MLKSMLATISQFTKIEPGLGGDRNIRMMIDHGFIPRKVIVELGGPNPGRPRKGKRKGGRLYINLEAWQEFVRQGGNRPAVPEVSPAVTTGTVDAGA
jgi:hypothetical protein